MEYKTEDFDGHNYAYRLGPASTVEFAVRKENTGWWIIDHDYGSLFTQYGLATGGWIPGLPPTDPEEILQSWWDNGEVITVDNLPRIGDLLVVKTHTGILLNTYVKYSWSQPDSSHRIIKRAVPQKVKDLLKVMKKILPEEAVTQQYAEELVARGVRVR